MKKSEMRRWIKAFFIPPENKIEREEIKTWKILMGAWTSLLNLASLATNNAWILPHIYLGIITGLFLAYVFLMKGR